jgi:uncharacterized lipoprotein YddW (UPF0748 family)
MEAATVAAECEDDSVKNINNRAALIRRRIWRIVLAFVTSLSCSQGFSDLTFAEGSVCEVRGVWLNTPAFNSESRREDTLNKICRANLNTLFILAPPVRDNQGWSTHESFSALLEEAKSQGMSVHAWIANRYRTSGGVDFTLSQEQSKQVHWAIDLLSKYPTLDGIHFDYIRYEGWQKGDYQKMGSVSNTVRLAFNAIHRHFPEKFLTAAVLESTPNHANYKQDYIPQWFRDWIKVHPVNSYAPSGAKYQYNSLLQRFIDTIIPNGKAGYSVPQGFKYQQDSMGWLMGGFIDAIMPMEYTTNDTLWQENVKNWISFRDGETSGIYLGLGWLKKKGKPDYDYDAPGVVRKIKYGRQIGLKGFVIFQLAAFLDIDYALIDALAIDSEANNFDAPFENPVRSCLSSGSMHRAKLK